MRVLFKPYIVRDIMDLRRDAMRKNREIEKIFVTVDEMIQLKHELDSKWRGYASYSEHGLPIMVYGVPVEVER